MESLATSSLLTTMNKNKNKKLIDSLAAEFNVPADLLWFVWSCAVSVTRYGATSEDDLYCIADSETYERVKRCLGK